MAGVPKTDWIWMDGKLVPWEDARLHVLTHTLHYGMGCFEGTRVYKQADGTTGVFRLDDHLRRLQRSAHILKIDIGRDFDELREATLELVAQNRLEACYLRHIVFLGQGAMGLFPRDNPVRTAIVAWPWGAYLGEDGLEHGVRCKVSSFTRAFPNSSMTKAKATGNYVNSILAKQEAIGLGYDEAIMLDTNGFVSEASGENLFVVRDGILKTPELASALEGITRDSIVQLAKREGLEVRESWITRDEIYCADEAFMTGTAAEVTPVREVDDRQIGSGSAGPVTKRLQQAFFAAVRGEDPEFAEWLTPVALTRAKAAAAH